MFSLFNKTIIGLTKTRASFKHVFEKIKGNKILSNNDIDLLEECLIQADLGWETTDQIINGLSKL